MSDQLCAAWSVNASFISAYLVHDPFHCMIITHANVHTCKCTTHTHSLFLSHIHAYTQDLESKSLVDEIMVDKLATEGPVDCMSLAWSADGQTLFAGKTSLVPRPD